MSRTVLLTATLSLLASSGCAEVLGIEAGIRATHEGGGGQGQAGGGQGGDASGGSGASGGGATGGGGTGGFATGGGGTGGAGGGNGCIVPVTDTFDGSLASGTWDPWDGGASTNVVANELVVSWSGSPGPRANGLHSLDTFSLEACSMIVELVDPPMDSDHQAFFYYQMVNQSNMDRVGFALEGNTLFFNVVRKDRTKTDGDSETFDEDMMSWWRLREEAGTLYWDTSANGINWDEQHQAPVEDQTINGFVINIGGGVTDDGAPGGDVAFDNVNTPP